MILATNFKFSNTFYEGLRVYHFHSMGESIVYDMVRSIFHEILDLHDPPFQTDIPKTIVTIEINPVLSTNNYLGWHKAMEI